MGLMWALPLTQGAVQAFPCCARWLRPEIAQLRGVALHRTTLMVGNLRIGTRPAFRPSDWQHRARNGRGYGGAGFGIDTQLHSAAPAPRIFGKKFSTIMMGDDRAIAATYVAGQRV